MNKVVPESQGSAGHYKVITAWWTRAIFLEVHREWARKHRGGFARIQGIVVGIVANNSSVKAGTRT